MSSLPEPPTHPQTAVHPPWCDRQHAEDYPVHTADVGAQDIELGERDLSVSLFQSGGEPMQVWLCEHSHDETTVIALTPEQAEELGRRLLAAAGTGVHETVLRPLGPGLSGPGAAS